MRVSLIEKEGGIDRRGVHVCDLGYWHGDGWMCASAFACEVDWLT